VAGDRADVLICEGVGGLMVPLTTGYLIRDLALDLQLPLVIAARPGLGTISHSLMAVDVARTAGLEVAAVVMTPWPDDPSEMERSNRATIEQIGRVPVATLTVTSPTALAAAGDALPLQDWLP
jgi:dethiobiotin synthetase